MKEEDIWSSLIKIHWSNIMNEIKKWFLLLWDDCNHVAHIDYGRVAVGLYPDAINGDIFATKEESSGRRFITQVTSYGNITLILDKDKVESFIPKKIKSILNIGDDVTQLHLDILFNIETPMIPTTQFGAIIRPPEDFSN